jgi:hypothetical protein
MNEPTGSIVFDEETEDTEILRAQVRALRFAKGMMYSLQMMELLPLVLEIEERTELHGPADEQMNLVREVLQHALAEFPAVVEDA